MRFGEFEFYQFYQLGYPSELRLRGNGAGIISQRYESQERVFFIRVNSNDTIWIPVHIKKAKDGLRFNNLNYDGKSMGISAADELFASRKMWLK